MQWCLPELPGNGTRENVNRCEIQYLGNVHHQLDSYQSTVRCSYLGIMVILKASELVPRLSKQTHLKLWLITEYKGKLCVKDTELCILYKQTHTHQGYKNPKLLTSSSILWGFILVVAYECSNLKLCCIAYSFGDVNLPWARQEGRSLCTMSPFVHGLRNYIMLIKAI